ncbi:MAG: sulfatase-like hydrolase/transferase [Verrucomicrobia bacterium]|nr:sulfatase-like hydrolase/transferase [Verrucomicrobiota bacterium]
MTVARMPRHRFPPAAVLSFLPALLLAVSASALQPPNVLFILCDDLGYGDLGVLHQNAVAGTKKHATPNLDALAAAGIQLRSHYCGAPVCAPSRASLLTGLHQGHATIRDNQFDVALETNHNLATVLKQAGYATAAVGKWGLQGTGSSPSAWSAYPTKRGFDFFFGYVRHKDGHSQYPFHSTYDPDGSGTLVRGPMEVYEQNLMVRDDLAKCYTTDLFTARAKKWIIDHRAAAPAQPFFLYLAYSTPHAALHIPTTAYPPGGGLSGGVQWLGTPGAMINTATGTIDSFIHPNYAGQAWTSNEKRFATSVRRIDDCVGDLRQTLADLGIAGDTLVVFTSDNGPHHESFFNAAYEANSFDSFGPFDGTKRDLWEGGVRVPVLACWPAAIPPGRVSHRPSQFHDWLPTLAEAAGLSPPAHL